MKLLDEILIHNKEFVKNKKYEAFRTSKFPDKRLVILTCMDTRLTEMLPRALNIKNGDAKIIQNAGAVISHPFGSIMRSIIVAIYDLGAAEVCIVGHHGCGMAGLKANTILEKAKSNGVKQSTIDTLQFAGIDMHAWLKGFAIVEESVQNSVEIVKQHPLFPSEIPVHGLVIDPETGEIEVIVNGYENMKQ